MIPLLLSILALILLLAFLIGMSLLNRLSSSHLVAPEITPIDPMSQTRERRAIIEHESGDLRHLGFRFHSTLHCNELSSEPTFHSTGWVFDHPVLPVLAILWLPDFTVSQKRNTGLEFLSWNATHCFLTSPIVPSDKIPPGFHHKVTTFCTRSDKMLELHLQGLKSLTACNSPFHIPGESVLERIRGVYQAIYEYNLRQCYCTPDAQGRARRKPLNLLAKTFSNLLNFPLLQRYISSNPAVLGPFPEPLFPDDDRPQFDAASSDIPPLGEGEPSASPEIDPVKSEIINYRQIALSLEKNHIGARGKWTLLAISAVLFIGIFGGLFSLTEGIILFLVILFHELGHIAAMKFMGYRDLQILFIPGLGALASGREQGAIVAWKKAVILLMGPLPGFLVGIMLAIWVGLSGTNTSFPIESLIAMLIAINLFNLLPFHPLDGGQLLNTLVFNRWPLFKAVFFVFSSLLLVWLGFALDSVFFMLVFVLVGYASANEAFRNARFLRRIRKNLPRSYDHGDEDLLLGHILPELRSLNLNDFKRYARAKSLLTDLKTENAGTLTTTLFLGFYSMPLWLPLALILAGSLLWDHRLDNLRNELGAVGYPLTYAEFLESVPDEENALPLLLELGEWIGANPLRSAAFAQLHPIQEFADRFPHGEPLTDELRDSISEALNSPDFHQIDDLISRIKAKRFVFDPDLQMQGFLQLTASRETNPAYALRSLLLSRALTQPEQAWDHFLDWLQLVHVLDPLPFRSEHSLLHELIPQEAVAMVSMIDQVASPPPAALRSRILDELDRLRTPSSDDYSIMCHYGIAVTADPDLDTYFPTKNDTLLSRIGGRQPGIKRFQFHTLEDLRDLEPDQPLDWTDIFQSIDSSHTWWIFDDGFHNRIVALGKTGSLNLWRRKGFEEAKLLIQIGWEVHDHIIRHGNPPKSLSGILSSLSHSSPTDSMRDSIHYEPVQESFRLSLTYQEGSLSGACPCDETEPCGPHDELWSAIHWTGHRAVIPPPDPELEDDCEDSHEDPRLLPE